MNYSSLRGECVASEQQIWDSLMHAPFDFTEFLGIGKLSRDARQASPLNLTSSVLSEGRHRPVRLLSFSRDHVLGETRQLVLKSRYDVIAVNTLDEFAALVCTGSIAAIVLCHTLSFEDCRQCLALASSSLSAAQFILVAANTGRPQPEFQHVVRGLAGPEALLHAVQQVLQLPPTQYTADLIS